MFGGNYLLIVSSVLAPDFPFQFLTVVDPNVVNGQQSAEAYPLSLYVNSTTMPRARLEPPIPFDIQLGDELLVFGFTTTIPGEANPITGTDASVVISFEGFYFPERDFVCGGAFGLVEEPLEANLTGSTFSMVPIVDGLPEPFPLGCE